MSNDVLVEVKSTYDATGTQAADRAQVNLANTTKEVGRQMETTEKQTQKARQALGGLSAAAAASQGSFGGFAMALQNLGGGLADVAAKFAMVGGALSAGYGIGTTIDKWLGLSDAISGASDKGEALVSVQDKIRKRLGDIEGASLKAVAAEFDALSKSVASSISELQKMQSVANELRGKKTAAETAELEAGLPPGTEKDRAMLLKRRQAEAEDIAARKAQEEEKYRIRMEALQKGKKIATQAAYEPLKQESLLDYFERNPQGTILEKDVEDRLRKETAAKKAEAARKELRKLQEEEAAAAEEKQNAMTGLDYESRTSVAKYQAGRAGIDRTEETEAGRAAKAEQDAREAAQGRAGGSATAAQRRYQMEQRNTLTQRQAQLQNRQSEIESALPGARVDDLRSAAAAGDKARGAASAAVASMMKALQDVTSQLEAVNDKLNNLPK